MDIDLSVFASNLKKFRQQKGFNQQDFAIHLRIGQNNVSRYEKGTVEPKISVVIAMAKALDVSLDTLCGLNETTPSELENLAKKTSKTLSDKDIHTLEKVLQKFVE